MLSNHLIIPPAGAGKTNMPPDPSWVSGDRSEAGAGDKRNSPSSPSVTLEEAARSLPLELPPATIRVAAAAMSAELAIEDMKFHPVFAMRLFLRLLSPLPALDSVVMALPMALPGDAGR